MKGRRGHGQQGSVGIEFALVFPLFLIVFYAIVSYSLLFVYQQGLHTLSADAVRQALAVERKPDGTLDEAAIEAVVNGFIEESAHWPGRLAERCNDDLVPSTGTVRVCVKIELGLVPLKLPGSAIGIPHFTSVHSTSSIRL
ncbi:TadE/TadG family type IV pilus assembly protein [Halomonas koreensis]|uniref:Pilus assembly protein n=1 Tax=Halomonas koreensis TaxID=245385 RepID=A0ABU1G3A5_9GAMM|nr:pilus assembly protein [Halomonas koreensis]MDR5867048.1 pilus assembly protein [Halomonas koreensis]